jgi:hypothetical protein
MGYCGSKEAWEVLLPQAPEMLGELDEVVIDLPDEDHVLLRGHAM